VHQSEVSEIMPHDDLTRIKGSAFDMRKTWTITTLALLLILTAFNSTTIAQSDADRKTLAITYPLNQTVYVAFSPTTRLPRLTGQATVKRQGRRGTRVELNMTDVPRAYELGSVYTTFVLWAISPDGHVDNLGEIKRSGSVLVDTKIDVTTPLQTFALIVTAEPHFLVKVPSRMVILENRAPISTRAVPIETMQVQYIGNSSDYFRDVSVPPMADANFTSTPIALLGARQAIKLARFAGADQDAPNELRAAQADLEQAESAWRMKEADRDVDILARQAIGSGTRAEELAVARRVAREKREEIQRRDEAIRAAENNAANANEQIDRLKAELQNERHARELADRDALSATEQLRDARSEIVRLRDEMQGVRADAEDAKVRLARIEGEKQADDARRAAEKRASEQRAAAETLKQALSRFGTVRDSSRGMTLVLTESLWVSPRSSKLAASATAKLEPLAALLANNTDYQITIESFTDDRGGESVLQQLTQDRARVVSERLAAAGVDVTRMQPNGMGASNPIAPNTTLANRAKNRRTEVTLTLSGQ
jgi:outer membrane protein OmpA-like peptidoglycan-associated protein